MPLDKLLTFTKKVQDLADKPNSTMTATEVKAQFDAAPNELRLAFNQLIDDLQSVVDGDSGADNVSATTIAGLTGNTVQSLLETLKTLVDTKSNSTDVYTRTVLDGGQLDARYYTESELQSVTDSTSGADKVGATAIVGLTGVTVQGLLESLKGLDDTNRAYLLSQIQNTVLGQIPDGTITLEKLAFAIASTATDVSITDAGNYFTSTNAEGALQELGLAFNGARGDLNTSVTTLLGS